MQLQFGNGCEIECVAQAENGTLRPSALAVVRSMMRSKFGGLLDRQFGRLRTAENLVDKVAVRRHRSGKFGP
jgi:hypothetical protein